MMLKKMKIFFRADASPSMGSGHIMRCIALAQACRAHGAAGVTFITSCHDKALKQRILKEGFELLTIPMPHPEPSDLKKTLKILSDSNGSWLILDGYHFVSEYQLQLLDSGCHLLVIDDTNHLPEYHCDILLNQNINASELNYSCDKNTIRLLGSKYVMLRQEFLHFRNSSRIIPGNTRKILVTMGGSDPDNTTLKVINALNMLESPELDVKIVAGPLNPHLKSLRNILSASAFKSCLLTFAKNMPELMAWADLAISAGGSTCWELAYMGLPAVVLVIAENQHRIAEGLHEKGAVVNLGLFNKVSVDHIANTVNALLLDLSMRKNMAHKAKKTVDGSGGRRVINLITYTKNENINFRAN